MIDKRTIKFLPSTFISLAIILSCLLIAISAIFFANNFESRGFTYLLITILGLLAFGPILLRIIRHSLDLAEPAIWFVLYYFTHFGLRAIYDIQFGSQALGIGPKTLDLGLLNEALIISIVGLLSFWLGYRSHLGKAIRNSLSSLPKSWNKSCALLIALLCVGFGWILRIFLIFQQAGGISAWLKANKNILFAQAQGITYLSIFSNLTMVGLLIIFILARLRRKFTYWLLFTLIFVPDVIFRFFSGSRAQFIFLLSALLIALYMTSRRGYRISMQYAKWATILIILFIILFPLFSVMRGGIRNLNESLLRTSSFWRNPLTLSKLIAGRQNGLDSLTLIINRIPKDENYTLGSELWLLMVAWIPRKIWSDKPTISIGKIFYNKFYPPIYHEGTAVAPTLVGEFYWDLGLVGVIIGMLLIGALWRFFFEYLVKPRDNLSNILIVSAMFPLFFVVVEQSIISLLTMHLFQFFVIVLIVLILRGKSLRFDTKLKTI